MLGVDVGSSVCVMVGTTDGAGLLLGMTDGTIDGVALPLGLADGVLEGL